MLFDFEKQSKVKLKFQEADVWAHLSVRTLKELK